MDATGPALPWAATVAEEVAVEASPAETEFERGMTLEAAGLTQGSRIEVKWHVEPEDGESYARWWGATVVGPSKAEEGAPAQQPNEVAFDITYDAHGDFDPEGATVVLTSEHTLRQRGQDDELAWRKEGDTWDLAEDAEDGEGEEGEGDDTVTTAQLRELVEDREYLGGKTLEQVEAEALGSMPPDLQITMAAGFRDFANSIKSFLSNKAAAGGKAGGEVVVTADDVKQFMDEFTKNKRQRMA